MALRDDYAGPFDPGVGLADFSRQALAHLGREYLLSGHLQDRVGLPLAARHFGGDAYVQLAIEEWMGASPVYSLRMQRAMGFEGHDVGTVFKNLQLDIGAPHQFMDFQFRLDRPDYGEFWLPHCGALLDVELLAISVLAQLSGGLAILRLSSAIQQLSSGFPFLRAVAHNINYSH